MILKEDDIMRIIKLLYIILVISALTALTELQSSLGVLCSQINETYLSSLCDTVFISNGILTAFAIIFRERLILCTKCWFSIHTTDEYSSLFWIFFCQALFLKNSIFYDPIFDIWINLRRFSPLFHRQKRWKVEIFFEKSRVFHIFH